MYRTQSPTSRQEYEMSTKSLRELEHRGTSGDPLERLRLLCLSRGATGIMGLGRMLRRLDDNGNKQLNLDEFVHGLRETGLEISDEEARSLFEHFDENNSGCIDVTEFLIKLRPPMSESRKKVVDEAFRKMFKPGDDRGDVTIDDLKHAYNVKSHSKYVTGEESEDMIIKRFLLEFEQDATENGKVTHEEFMNYYSAISASIDNDCYFDLMMRQAYKL